MASAKKKPAAKKPAAKKPAAKKNQQLKRKPQRSLAQVAQGLGLGLSDNT